MKSHTVAVLLASLATGLVVAWMSTTTTTSYYKITFSKLHGEDQTTVDVSGPGIKDSIVFSGDIPHNVENTDNSIVIGNTMEGIYSDQEGSLVLVNGGNCEKRSYQKRKAPVSSKMSIPECEKIKATMRVVNMNNQNNSNNNDSDETLPIFNNNNSSNNDKFIQYLMNLLQGMKSANRK